MIRILHLSDIQYGRHHVDRDGRPPLYGNEKYSLQLEKLIGDLKILEEQEALVPNFIVVTGDIAERSLRDEYKTAAEFLGGLADHLKIDRRRVVMVPGNHDINRKVCQAARLMADAEGETFNPPYFPKFKFYKEFFDDFYTDASSYQFTEDLFVNFLFPEEGVAFVGLNSCIDESELGPHYGNITVGQLKKATDELNDHDPDGKLLRIALMHHNFVRSSDNDEENLRDGDDLKPLLMKNNIRLILHGHQHVPRQEVTGEGDRIIHVLATGSAGLDSGTLPDTPRRYQIIQIDNREVRVYRRFFDNTHPGTSGKGAWKPDMAPGQSKIFDSFTITGPEAGKENRPPEIPVAETPVVLKIPDAYKKWITNDCCKYMDFQGLQDRGKAVRADLPEVFVPLFAQPPAKTIERGESADAALREHKQPVDIERLIAENDYLLIEGEAGSGKTTLFKHLCHMMIREPDYLGLGGWLPVLVFLKDLRDFDFDGKDQNAELAGEILACVSGKHDCCIGIKEVIAYAKAGKALFLLDGLDEIGLHSRNAVVRSFEAFCRKHGGGRICHAGRPHGISGTVLDLHGDRRVQINPLSMEQTETFIEKWFAGVEGGSTASTRKTSKQMIAEIRVQEGVRQLIDNPLMLTAVCILYYDQKELPGQRAELYKKFVENMLHRRFDNPGRVLEFLMTLANEMHTLKRKGLDRQPALDILARAWRKPDVDGPDAENHFSREFDRIESNCGLTRFEGGQLMFRHLTFQEYLTAASIVSRERQYDKAILDLWEDEWYREVIELYIGLLSIDNRNWANFIVRDALEKKEAVPYYRRRLAARSFLDIQEDRRDADVLDLAVEKLREIMRSDAEPNDRADAGEILGRLGDGRDLEVFIKIPDGEYKTSVGKVALESFEMAKYPVTNQWYQKFVDAGGYENDEFWTTGGLEWRGHIGERQPRYWHEMKWNCPNHPVVGVCWWEAVAFCRWLTASRDDGLIYRLPSEVEWEAAAAGLEKREFPWGQNFDKSKCNTSESGIKKTSAVGIFKNGETPEGVDDLPGNVWEWTCTNFIDSSQQEDFPFDEKVNELYLKKKYGDAYQLYKKTYNMTSAVRGGAWNINRGSARCGYRYGYDPFYRYGLVGFRISRTYL